MTRDPFFIIIYLEILIFKNIHAMQSQNLLHVLFVNIFLLYIIFFQKLNESNLTDNYLSTEGKHSIWKNGCESCTFHNIILKLCK